MGLTRKEQVFKACSVLQKEGFKLVEQFTLQSIINKCTFFGFPAGNKKYIRKYRDEWLDTFFVENDEALPVVSGSAHVQFSLDSLLNEHKQKIEQELKAKYKAAFEKLSEEKRQTEMKVEDAHIELDDITELLKHARNEAKEFKAQVSELTLTNNRLSERVGGLTVEQEVLKEEIENKTDEYSKHLASIKKDNDYLNKKNEEQISFLKKSINELNTIHEIQLKEIKSSYQQTTDSLKESSEATRHESIKREDALSTELKTLRTELIELKKDNSKLEVVLDEKRNLNELLDVQLNVILDELKQIKTIKPTVESLLKENKQQFDANLRQVLKDLTVKKKIKVKGVV